MSVLERLSAWLENQKLDAILISSRTGVRYFSGFAGTAGVLVVTKDQRKIFVDSRYVLQAGQTAPEYETVQVRDDPLDAAGEFLRQQGLRRIGFEGEKLTVVEFRRLNSKIPPEQWVSVSLDPLRSVKTVQEIEKIAAAAAIADAALAKLLPLIRPGETEQSLAALLEYEMRKLGSERPSFTTIFASGPRAALPHGAASARELADGDLVVIDFGAVFEGYHSDMTRTVCIGAASSRQRKIYDTVLAAQMAGLAAIRPGISSRAVDKIARDVIESAGLGAYFGHGLGHGVGLDIHESPRLSPTADEVILEPGMVVSVEPGVYLPEWGGIRIEDLVVVTETGCRIFSQTRKDLLELG